MRCLILLGLALALPVAAAADAPSKEEVANLVKQLKEKNPTVRNNAARALESLDPSAKDAVPVLTEALHEQGDPIVPSVAAKALARLGANAVPALIEVLQNKEGQAQAYAAIALQRIGPDGKAATPALVEVIKKHKDLRHNARLQAIAALGKIGPGAKAAVSTLIDCTKEKPALSPARLAAVIALGQIGPEAKDAAPVLVDLLGEEETKVGPLRLEAARALGRIGPTSGKEAVSALVALVETKKLGPTRIVAINALGEMGSEAKNAVPALKSAQQENELKSAAARAIEKIEKAK
jgi:HEAT repeat protein